MQLYRSAFQESRPSARASGSPDSAPQTTPVPITLDVDLAQSSDAQAAVAQKSEGRLLRAYLLDAGSTPVALRLDQGSAAGASLALPVTVTGAHTRLQLHVLLPEGAEAWGIGLQLLPAEVAAKRLVGAQEGVARSRADAVTLGVMLSPLPAADVAVRMTPATSLGLAVVNQTLPAASWATRQRALADLAGPLSAAQATLEQNIAPGAQPFGAYAAAVYAGLAGRLLVDGTTQQAVAQGLRAALATSTDANAQAVGAILASRFEDTLAALGLLARSALATPTAAAGQVFSAPYAAQQATALRNLVPGSAALAYAPRVRSFVDTDLTAAVGGVLTLAPAAVAGGISGYNIYLGSDAGPLSRGVPLGFAAVAEDAAADVQFVVPAATAVPSGMNKFWIYPVSAKRELNAGTSYAFTNATVPVVTPQLVPGQNLVTLSWPSVVKADGYVLYRGNSLPLTEANVLRPRATSPYVDTDVDVGVPLYYALSVVQSGVLGPQSTALAAAPAPSTPPVLVASANPNGSTVRLAWTAVPLATAYNLYTDANTPVTTASAAEPNLLATAQNIAVAYTQPAHAAVAAIIRGRETALSNEVTATAVLAPPLQVRAFSPAAGEVQLSWLPAPGAIAYRIYSGLHAGLTLSDASFDTPTNLVITQDVTDSVLNSFAVLALDGNGATSVLSSEVQTVPGVVPVASGALAARVWGQADGNSNSVQPGLDASHFFGTPAGLAYSLAADTLFVADVAANRVLGLVVGSSAVPGPNDANVVLGQVDATSRVAGAGAASLRGPLGLSCEDAGTALWLVDANNLRVLGYNNVDVTGAAATLSLGSPSPAQAGTGGASATTFVRPAAVRVGGGRLVVVDSGGHRVLLYNQIPTASNTAADVVLGQADFSSTLANSGNLSAASLNTPSDAYTDGNRLLVYDYGNSRVLVWNTFPTVNGTGADVVLGQVDMVHNADNVGNANAVATGLAQHHRADTPLPQLACNGAELAIADPGNNRVLLYAAIPSVSGAPASAVLGQRLLTSRTSNNPPQRDTLARPTGVTFAGALSIFVADTGNNRVLRYGL